MDQIKRALASKQFSKALELLEGLSTDLPEEEKKEQLYLLAVTYRYLKNFRQAEHSLRSLLSYWPEYGRAFQELAHCYRDQDNLKQARSNYYQAVRYNPALHASWTNLASLEQALGQPQQAERNQQQAKFLLQQPKEVLAAMNLFHEGKYYKAEKICRAFLQKQPHHIEAMRTLANIGSKLDVLNDAEFLLESALVLEPDYDHARFDYVKVLQRRQKHEAAYTQAQRLHKKQPENPAYKALYANQCAALDKYEQALELYDQILTSGEGDIAGILLAKGHVMKALGDTEKTVEYYQQAYAARPTFGDAYWSLANLKTYRFSKQQIEQMEQQVSQETLPTVDKIHLLFALGKALEDAGDYQQAFYYYQQGNRLKSESSSFNAGVLESRMELQKEFFSSEKVTQIKAKEPVRADRETPIFIVGLPRAGSTLIEQILASHSQIEGTMELPNIPALAHGLNGRQLQSEQPRYPGILDEFDSQRLTELGDRYLQETNIYRSGKAYFTDKMPNNFRHIGLIKSILPNAKIIDARRHPLDCCVSGFKQFFAEGQEFSYDLEVLGRYYRYYLDLMDHWHSVYPGEIYTLVHEQLVEDPEQQITELLGYLDLPVEQQCFDFHKTERTVKTASSEQVRQPINRSGMGQWKRYEPYIEPLINELKPVMERWDKV
ncbi:tetratricopeptide repeat-containing sulfotransferase family protein [Idiomarina seosinensis]|uniref:Uncharacterized protein n=1 Tax=Idiomarina seosinensis TaxID=281739 RepID=A0A432Z4L9_9GAMM|nr:tetratricopeptide repeat-containing sulfotransferase family protein [Idiomarina seosinensis]RUO72830.1 hypothetical protein CWI81_12680 [Idiomarina seosinensis]